MNSLPVLIQLHDTLVEVVLVDFDRLVVTGATRSTVPNQRVLHASLTAAHASGVQSSGRTAVLHQSSLLAGGLVVGDGRRPGPLTRRSQH